MSDNKKRSCDNHPDIKAKHFLGNDIFDNQRIQFKIVHRFCDECYKEWRKKNFVIERT